MGLVANYGSDSDAGSGSESEHEEPTPAPAPVSKPTPTPTPLASGATGASLFSKLAAPKNKKKRVIQLFTPINIDALSAPDEDEGPKKVQKRSTKGSSLKDLLPPPKADGSAPALGMGRGGFGSSGGTALDLGGTSTYKGTAAAASNPASSSHGDPEGRGYGQAAPHQLNAGYSTQQETQTYMYAHQVAGPAAYGYDALYAQAPGPAAPPPDRAVPPSFFDNGASGATSEEDLLQRALQEEMLRNNRTGRGADPFKKMAVPQMVEVKQSTLTTSARPMETMAEVGVATAFGPQYAAKLKKEAGAKPDQLLRRKHQIGSLYYDAKVRELEMFENKSKGMKSRSQTQGKYGWV
eukprot:CAMPEP_0118929754 /NCGR_PEP_ID=MMETSP1169-20130426/6663_1 /TAXON_ID=36882 /ORGANISM="Pyramimonas obovata, Strain CCMP722" /LENGTH=350 /DNA_ID=CAMNT_0006872003 /DNA_START=172 /DNA_END=1224 /DNA_ORIENTATION=-